MKSIKVITALFLIFSVTFTLFYGSKKIGAEKLTSDATSYQGVISMWQIDSFEGGIGSRKQFLLKVARGFERKNKGILVMVTDMTKTGAEEQFKNCVYPDLISYGNGVELQNLSEFTTNNTVKGGFVGDKIYATAWCRGGYAIIENPNCEKEQEKGLMVVSNAEYTQPIVSLLENGYKTEKIEVLQPMDAYVKFVSGKVKWLLGTQRDVNRLETRGMSVKVTPLEKFNDLYQYVSITSGDQLKRYYAEQFINYLVSEPIQKQVGEIGMLSCFYKIEHQNEHLSKMQNVSDFNTISTFTPSKALKELQRTSLIALRGDNDEKIKIKNMLI